MHYLSMGAIFRMENSWLEEWIQYHLAVGVEHFYLINDDEDTHVSDRILRPYMEQGLVENIHVSDLFNVIRKDQGWRQQDSYREIIRNSTGQTKWLAMIDLDEFILPRKCDDIREVMQEYEEHSGLAINWQIYGSSNHIKCPPTQISHLLHRAETHWPQNQYIKSIIKPELVITKDLWDVHRFSTQKGETVNENHEPVPWMSHAISTEKIRINHYVLRSWQDFWEVKVPRPRFGNFPALDQNYFEFHDRNEVFDDEISRRFGVNVDQIGEKGVDHGFQ